MSPLVAGLLGGLAGNYFSGDKEKNLLDLLGKKAKANPPTDPNVRINGVEQGFAPRPPQPQPQQSGGFMSGLKDAWNDEEKRARMTIAFNSLRHKPDANIAQSMENKIKALQGKKKSNSTADYLAKTNPKIAEMLRQGIIDPKTAISMLSKDKPSALMEKMQLWAQDPEKFALMKEAGVIGGGGTTINMGGDAYDKTASTGFAEDDRKVVALAKGAPALVQKAESVKELLNSGAINTGWLSNLKQGVDKVAASLGGKAALSRLSNTELFTALVGSDVFPMIKQLGIGARGLDTPAEREFLLAVMVGTATMTTETLLKMTQRRIDMAERNISIYNSYLSEGKLEKYQKNRGYKFQPISSKNVVQWSDM